MVGWEVGCKPGFLINGDKSEEDGGDAGGAEDGAGLLLGEIVGRGENEGDGCEREVEDCPGKGDPEAEEEYDGFGEEHGDGSEEGDFEHGCQRAAFFVCKDFPAYADD